MGETECRSWAAQDPLMLDYHDRRWCRPVHDDRELFALLCLEGQQAGLAWSTIIRKEAAIRAAFDGFDIDAVARYDEVRTDALMNAPGIVRNRLKIRSAIQNARAIQALLAAGEYRSFDEYVWHFTAGQTIVHHPKTLGDIPAQDALSEAVSRDMKRRGFSFVGPVIIYSFLQAIGVYDDHLDGCPCKTKVPG